MDWECAFLDILWNYISGTAEGGPWKSSVVLNPLPAKDVYMCPQTNEITNSPVVQVVLNKINKLQSLRNGCQLLVYLAFVGKGLKSPWKVLKKMVRIFLWTM